MTSKIMIIISALFVMQAQAETTTAVQWKTGDTVTRVTMADVQASQTSLLGYISDLIAKKDSGLCYQGLDYEAIDLIYAGTNHKGEETCNATVSVDGAGNIYFGPCWKVDKPQGPQDTYILTIGVCK